MKKRKKKQATAFWYIFPLNQHTSNSIGIELAKIQNDDHCLVEFEGEERWAYRLTEYRFVQMLYDSAETGQFKFDVGQQITPNSKIRRWKFLKKSKTKASDVYQKAVRDLKNTLDNGR